MRAFLTASPGWLKALASWRVAVIAAAIVGLVRVLGDAASLTNTSLWGLAIALGLTAVWSAISLLGMIKARHIGRVSSLMLDVVLASAASFLALNVMGMFVALDTAGEAFNGRVGWLVVIFVGWVISGLSEKAGDRQSQVAQIGRWVMLGGFAVLTISMGLIPGLIEFVRRAISLDALPWVVTAAAAAWFARTAFAGRATSYFSTSRTQLEAMDGLLFAAPNIIGFLVFFAGPLAFSLVISFTEWDGLTDAVFIGLGHYQDLFSDTLFLRSLRNIVVFGAVAVPGAVVPALLLAALLNSKLAGMRFFRAVYFLPSIAGVVGVTLIWKQLFNSTVGFLNFAILNVTDWFNSLLGTGITAPQPQWISDSSIALISVMIVFIWQQIGFNTVLFLAGMQGISQSLYEAAEVDGAGPTRRLLNITIPMLRPTTVFVVATTTILALQLFNEPFILQAPSPAAGPNNATLSPVVYLYQNAFQEFQIGYASAVAWVLFLLIFGVTLLYFRRSGEDGVLSS
jgi:ABC-type sugar transport system permease subunit